MSEEMRTALTAPGTPDELYGTIISLVDKGIRTIKENIDWYLGQRKAPPSTFVSSFYHPTEGAVMETFLLTANSLIQFGRSKASLQGALLEEAREKSLLQLALLNDLIAAVEPLLTRSEKWLLKEISRFFAYATDSFFTEIETARYWWLSRLAMSFEVDSGLLIARYAIRRFHLSFLSCERKRQGLAAETPDFDLGFAITLGTVTRVAYPIFSAVQNTPRHKDILEVVAHISESKETCATILELLQSIDKRQIEQGKTLHLIDLHTLPPIDGLEDLFKENTKVQRNMFVEGFRLLTTKQVSQPRTAAVAIFEEYQRRRVKGRYTNKTSFCTQFARKWELLKSIRRL